METTTYTSKTLDHLGFIAGIMREIDLASLIVQKGKPTSNPTARWVFPLFAGIHVLNLPDGHSAVRNGKPVCRDVLALFSYQSYYS